MLKDIISAKKDLFEAGAHTELRLQRNRERYAALLAGDVVENLRSDTAGVSARVYRGGRYGFSSMAECSAEAAERVLRAASENAAFLSAHAPGDRPPLPPLPHGRVISEAIGDPAQRVMFLDALKRIRRTAPMKGLDAWQRKANVEGAFELKPGMAALIKNKSAAIVDDIMTTGSTLSECARVLKEAGAARAITVTFASGGDMAVANEEA